MDDTLVDPETGLLDLSCMPAEQLRVLTDNVPLDAALAYAVERIRQEVAHPSDIVVAQFDSSR
jgi:hypothetical protein